MWNDSDSVFPAGTVPAYARPRAHRRVKGPPVSIVSTDTHQEVVDYCSAHMAAFMVPRYVEFLDQQFDRRTPTLRIEKNALRQSGERGITPATWDRLKVAAAE